MTTFNYFKTASTPIKIAAISFLVGTIIFIGEILFPDYYQIKLAGLAFIVLAVVVNSITLFFLILNLLSNTKKQQTTIAEILIVLCNIPIAALYLFILIYQFNL